MRKPQRIIEQSCNTGLKAQIERPEAILSDADQEVCANVAID